MLSRRVQERARESSDDGNSAVSFCRPVQVGRAAVRGVYLVYLLLSFVFASTACRELTTPTQPNPDMILARGLVLDAINKPAAGVHVSIHSSAEELASKFSARLITDEEGKFSVWVPTLPLLVSFRPNAGSKLPNEDRENVQFSPNELRTFSLLGDYHIGVIGPARYADSLKVARVVMATYVDRIDGGQDGLSASTSVEVGGSFEIHLPQAGRYRATIDRCCALSVHYTWPDSIEVARGDTIHLDLPLVFAQVGFTMGGAPLPDGAFYFAIRPSSTSPDYVRTRVFTNGQQEFFESIGLRGATRIEIEPYFSPALVGSPVISGNPGVLNFAPIRATIPALNDGDLFSLELGQYELQVQVLDAQGEPFPLVDVELTGESWTSESVDLETDGEGRAIFRVNPTGHELLISTNGYLDAYRYFTVTGDMQMTITLQLIPDEN